MRVLGARVIVKEEKQSDKTKSGILVSGNDKKPSYKGEVVAVGEGALLENGQRVPMNISIGDKVVYAAFAGSPVKDNGETFLILNERDILCVLD